MPSLITFGAELIRINFSKNRIEYSTSRGISWVSRYSGSSCGVFKDLVEYEGVLYACTDKGVYYSTSKGISWVCRSSTSAAKTFVSIQNGGRELLATTADGHLYYSTSKGISWVRRH